jgi:hypothetical protein
MHGGRESSVLAASKNLAADFRKSPQNRQVETARESTH